MVKEQRFGRKNGKGFYDYPASGPKSLWPGLAKIVGKRLDPDTVSVKDLKDRFLFTVALEAARCMAEGIVTDPREADVGSILGFGFAPYTGGALSFIDGMGLKAFVDARERARGEIRAALRAGREARPDGRAGRDVLRNLRREAEGGVACYPRDKGESRARHACADPPYRGPGQNACADRRFARKARNRRARAGSRRGGAQSATSGRDLRRASRSSPRGSLLPAVPAPASTRPPKFPDRGPPL